MRNLLLVLVLAVTASAQIIGKVHTSVPIPQSPNVETVDFLLDVFGAPAGGTFTYVNRQFALNYVGDFLCTEGCTFSGVVAKHHPLVVLPDGCIQYTVDLVGDFQRTMQGHVLSWSNSAAFYTQTGCGARYVAGDFSVTLVNK